MRAVETIYSSENTVSLSDSAKSPETAKFFIPVGIISSFELTGDKYDVPSVARNYIYYRFANIVPNFIKVKA